MRGLLFETYKCRFYICEAFTRSISLFEVLRLQLNNCSENLDKCCNRAFTRPWRGFCPHLFYLFCILCNGASFINLDHLAPSLAGGVRQSSRAQPLRPPGKKNLDSFSPNGSQPGGRKRMARDVSLINDILSHSR